MKIQMLLMKEEQVMNNRLKLISKGFVKDNPTFVLLLGMCPTLATTTSAVNGLSMGLATLFVLVLSNMAISAIAPVVPDKVHIPVYIVVIATFVTVLQFIMQAYTPAMYQTLGLFIPLIVVNCIVLGRAEAFANKNTVVDSALDGLGVGIGFTLSLTVIGMVREILGSGSVFGWKFISGDGMLAFVMAPGAFIVLGYLMVLFNKYLAKK
jgi:electron transport complex, RnfABCDGE type, E subunit